jgi:hypothetical protein
VFTYRLKDIMNCTEKETIVALLKSTTETIEGKDMFLSFLGSEEGNDYLKIARQIIYEATWDLKLEEVKLLFLYEQEKCKKYLEEGTDL